MKSKYEKLDTWLSGKNKPNLVRPALFAKELPDWSNPIRQACLVCEGVAGLIKACPERIYTELRRSSRMGQFLQRPKSLAGKSYGARGWVLHQNTDIWWATAPMDGWEGWFGDAGAGGKVTDVVAYSGSNSLEIAGGRDDLVPNWRRQSDGKWTLTVMQYVLTASVGTMDFGVMSVYNGGTEWLGSIITNCDTSEVSLDDLPPVDLIRNQWKELKAVMDFPNDVCTFYYDGVLLGETACPSAQAVDIWPGGNAGTIVYYDDFKFEPEE